MNRQPFIVRPRLTLTQATVIGLVGIPLLYFIYAVLLYASLSDSNRHKATGASNQKQILLGLLQYAQDYDERFPPAAGSAVVKGVTYSSNWAIDTPIRRGNGSVVPGILHPYIGTDAIFRDPSAPPEAQLTYMYNDLIATARQSDVANTGRTVLIMDGANVLVNVGHSHEPKGTPVDALVNTQGTCDAGRGAFVTDDVLKFHSSGANYGLADGHVKWFSPGAIYFPPRSSASRRHRDAAHALLGPDPKEQARGRKDGEYLPLRYNGAGYAGTFYLQ